MITTGLVIIAILIILYIIFVIYTAPTYKENKDGTSTCVDEGKSIKDLFKRKK